MTDEEENDELTKFHGYLMPFTQNSWEFLMSSFIFFYIVFLLFALMILKKQVKIRA